MRKPFLDNLRYGIVLSVAVYHVFYQFNSVGVITNVLIPGIPALDAPLYVLYPWFMAALFMISGICARYSLEKQTGKQYLKGKVRRQLIPSIAIIFLIGWSTGWVTFRGLPNILCGACPASGYCGFSTSCCCARWCWC